MKMTAIEAGDTAICPATKSDLPELERLDGQCGRYFSFDPPGSADNIPMAEQLEGGALPPGGTAENYTLMTVRAGDEIIGFMDFYLGYPKDDIAYISIFYLDEDLRRRGAGGRCVEAAAGRLKDMGLAAVRVGVSLRNWTALAFWHKLGFDRVTKVRVCGNADSETAGYIELERELGAD